MHRGLSQTGGRYCCSRHRHLPPTVRLFHQLLRQQPAVAGEPGKSFADPSAPVQVQRPAESPPAASALQAGL